jgi:hypothetical protein
MRIEVQDFYPHLNIKKGDKAIGTMHIYLPDEGFDIRGISVKNKGRNKFFFSIPYKKGWDFEEKRDVFYPCFTFTDLDKQKDFIASLVDIGTKFMLKVMYK